MPKAHNSKTCSTQCNASYKRKQRREARKIKYYKNVNFKLAQVLRSRLSGILKKGSPVRDLGCSIDEFRSYLESKWKPGMNWENHSKDGWHIDHIKRLADFDLTDKEQLLRACHYTNLQPMWAEIHRIKTKEENKET